MTHEQAFGHAGVVWRYGLAAAGMAAAVWARVLLAPILGNQSQFPLVLCAVVFAAWYGGLGPALFAVLFGALLTAFFLLEPIGSPVVQGSAQQLGLTIYVLSGLGIAALGASMHRAQRQANEVAERLKIKGALIENALEPMLCWDWGGCITFWNGAAERLYGYSSAEALGRKSHDLLQARTGADGSTFLDRLAADGVYEGELIHRTRDGREIVVETRMVLMRDGESAYVIEANRDVTTRSEAQDALRQANAELERRVRERTDELSRNNELLAASRARLANIVDSAMDAIITLDSRQHIVLFNAAAERMFGLPVLQALGQPLETLIPPRFRRSHQAHVDGFDAQRGSASMRSMRSPPSGGDLMGLRADGTEFPIETSISLTEATGEKLFTVILRDITERRQAEEAAVRLRIAEEQAVIAQRDSRMKSEFLASMSHELRTPLNAVLGFTDLLLLKGPGPLTPDQEKKLRQIHASGNRQLALIGDLLDLARIEAGRFPVEIARVVCADIVQKIVRGLKPAVEAKGLQLLTDVPDSIEAVRSDAGVLAKIVRLLADNAVKFTAAGSVTLPVRQHREAADGLVTCISVSDTGPGIRPADQDKLFLAFIQVDGASTRQHGGLGLGLHLSNKLAGLIGAQIEFRSEFGQGSVFTLRLAQDAAATLSRTPAPGRP